jgi:hypothetical protein
MDLGSDVLLGLHLLNVGIANSGRRWTAHQLALDRGGLVAVGGQEGDQSGSLRVPVVLQQCGRGAEGVNGEQHSGQVLHSPPLADGGEDCLLLLSPGGLLLDRGANQVPELG